MRYLLLFPALIFFIAMAGFCAGMETGLLAVPRVRLISFLRTGGRRVKRLARILSGTSEAITTLLVGNNIASVAVSTVSASIAVHYASSSPFVQVVWSAFIAVTMVMVGEYLPKLFFAAKPLRRCLGCSASFVFLQTLLFPIVGCFSWVVGRVFKVKESSARLRVSRDGLRNIVTDRNDATRLTSFERRLIERVLLLQTLFAKDLMHAAEEDERKTSLRLGSLTRADDILPAMRRAHSPFAVVFDENTGAELGIVTEEDVLHALTGVLKD